MFICSSLWKCAVWVQLTATKAGIQRVWLSRNIFMVLIEILMSQYLVAVVQDSLKIKKKIGGVAILEMTASLIFVRK